MRFTSMRHLPPSEWYTTRREAERVAQDLLDWNNAYGLDTEADGLGRRTVNARGKTIQVGDGLGANLEVLCLAFNNRRIGIDCGTACRENILPFIEVLLATQRWACGYNWIFDANVLASNTDGRLDLTTCLADGMILWQLFDEDAPQTDRNRDLKSRAAFWLGTPVSDFDRVVIRKYGDIRRALQDPIGVHAAQNYSTKDAWLHLGMVALGKEFASSLPWCAACPICGEPCFTSNADKTIWTCVDHGPQPIHGAPLLTMWDWHLRRDVPFLNVLKKIQQRGIHLDAGVLEAWIAPLEAAAAQAKLRFLRALGEEFHTRGAQLPVGDINLESPKQLQRLYFRSFDAKGTRIGLGLPVRQRTKSGGASMSEEAANALYVEHGLESLKALLEHRSLMKVLSGYLRGLPPMVNPADGRVHCRLRPEASTGRLIVKGPNLTTFQRDPTVIEIVAPGGPPPDGSEPASLHLEIQPRNAITAPGEDWVILSCDYSQIEVLVAAMEAEPEGGELTDTILAGMDMHSKTAALAYGPKMPGGMLYEDIVEAKHAKEGKLRLRLMTAWGALHGDTTTLLRRFAGGPIPPAVIQAIGGMAERVRRDERFAGSWGLRAQDLDETLLALLVEALGAEHWGALVGWLGRLDKEYLRKRVAAKSGLFGIFYGIGATGLAIQITTATGTRCPVEESKELIHQIRNVVYPRLGANIERLQNLVERYGYVRTRAGRYRHPSGILSGDPGLVAQAKRQASNAPIQGTVADIISAAMIAIDTDPELEALGARMVLQIHDELVFEAPRPGAEQALARIQHLMERAHRMIVPFPLVATGAIGMHMGEFK